MKIGILTLHDSVNYGAVAQACALARHLQTLGHEAVVIDRRRLAPEVDIRTPPLDRPYAKWLGLFHCEANNGMREAKIRIDRTRRFLRERVGLTPYAFTDWRDAPEALGVDAIVVGSDQVWNANNLDPADYLLRGSSAAVPGIAYAASIGMRTIPAEKQPVYREGLARFKAISMREREAARLVGELGFEAETVVDPVLLGGRRIWEDVLAEESVAPGGTFAYFLAEDFDAVTGELMKFATPKDNGRVALFLDWFSFGRARGFLKARRNARRLDALRHAGVDLCAEAGPAEFVRAIAAADRVVSNSYHALMFALIFGKEVRIVLPTNPVRRAMNSRLAEFEEIVSGPFLHDTLAEALASFGRGERCKVRAQELKRRVDASRAWLRNALEGIGA